MSINAVTEAIKALAQSLQVSTIFPALLFVLANVYGVLPRIQSALGIEVDVTSSPAVAIAASLALSLSYALYAFNFPLIQLLEGYRFTSLSLSKAMKSEKQLQHQSYWLRIDELAGLIRQIEVSLGTQSPETDERWRLLKTQLMQLENEFENSFPSDEASVQPTTLGNVIAAYEDYPRTRYGMEPTALWPRLVPILKQTNYLEFVTQEKTVFDFLLNTGLVFLVVGFELASLAAFFGNLGLAFLVIMTTLGIAYVFYHGLIVAADQWGITFRVAFDLHRNELRKRLGLRAVSDFSAEHRRWENVSDFLHGRTMEYSGFEHFVSESEIDSLSKTETHSGI